MADSSTSPFLCLNSKLSPTRFQLAVIKRQIKIVTFFKQFLSMRTHENGQNQHFIQQTIKENDVISICAEVTAYRSTYILNQAPIFHPKVQSFYSYLSFLLNRLLGSATESFSLLKIPISSLYYKYDDNASDLFRELLNLPDQFVVPLVKALI
ncbi:hypothetical protein K501DRAFT_269715 [Backusella circina FSU 941]|nr:hypothetical protein K501DRAFT_269715 [Backusella circina FSU 941]